MNSKFFKLNILLELHLNLVSEVCSPIWHMNSQSSSSLVALDGVIKTCQISLNKYTIALFATMYINFKY
jgi:hypothetical protein